MLKELTINELEAYLTLCERNLDFIGVKRRLNPTDKKTNDSFNNMRSLRNRLYEEINIRLEQFNNEHFK